MSCNRSLRSAARLVLLSTLVATGSLAIAGPLDPPAGPVGSTHKTLTEVEPRTAINATNTPGTSTAIYVISQPGSYYLMSDVVGQSGKHGIRVTANNVTIDLNGFTVRGVSGAVIGITDTQNENARIQNLTVRNGIIRGFQTQIFAENCDMGRFENLELAGGNPCLSFAGAVAVDRCVAKSTFSGSGIGFELLSPASSIMNCVSDGFPTGYYLTGGQIQGSVARGGQTGFSLDQGANAINCHAVGTSQHGFMLGLRSAARDCHVSSNSSYAFNIIGANAAVERCSVGTAGSWGITIQANDAVIRDNSITGCGNSAITVMSGVTGAHIEGNTGVRNYFGISVSGTDCTIIRNYFGRSPASNAVVYNFAAGNRFGAIVKANASAGSMSVTSTSAAVVGTTTATTDPFANLFY